MANGGKYWNAHQKNYVKKTDLRLFANEVQIKIATDWFFENWTNDINPHHHPSGDVDTIEIGLVPNPIETEFYNVLDQDVIAKACGLVEENGVDWGPKAPDAEFISLLNELSDAMHKFKAFHGEIGHNNQPFPSADIVNIDRLIAEMREAVVIKSDNISIIGAELSEQLQSNVSKSKNWLLNHLEVGAGKAIESIPVATVAGIIGVFVTNSYKIIAYIAEHFRMW